MRVSATESQSDGRFEDILKMKEDWLLTRRLEREGGVQDDAKVRHF